MSSPDPSAANPDPGSPATEPTAAGSEAGSPPDAESASAETTGKPESVIDAIADLMQMGVNYLRQETAGVMRDKVVLPGQKLGMLVAFALAAAFLVALGIGFLAVAFLLVLAQLLGWPGALAAIGGVLVLGAAVFTYLKVRSVQK